MTEQGDTGRGWAIWVVSPPGYPHSRAFDEHAHSLHYALGELGIRAPIVWQWQGATRQRRPLVLGPHLLEHCSSEERDLPADAILYNFEQVTPDSTWISGAYLDRLRQHEVWDYSRKNAHALIELGVTNIKLCPVGFARQSCVLPLAFRPDTEDARDIDVLFYGSISPRRQAILDGLRDRGAHVKSLFGVYGFERDRFIMRSKIVLNLHYYDSKIFEIVRVAHLLANRRFVVSERGDDPELEEPLADGVAFCDYEEVVDTCMTYLAAADLREHVARRGHEIFSKQSQAEILRKLIT